MDSARNNAILHDKIALQYEIIHGEIFNEIEQRRLNSTLSDVLENCDKAADTIRALDYGAGTGNLTKHLTAFGCDVVAADVSEKSLQLAKDRYSCDTVFMKDGSAKILIDKSFDLVATYSVLHHIPDYIDAIKQMARVCKPGGVIYIDHESSPLYWHERDNFKRVYTEISRFDWNKYLKLQNYINKFRSLLDKKFAGEGDIHVWPDDHIEWNLIDGTLEELGFRKLFERDFMLFKSIYRIEDYSKYVDICLDTRCAAYKHQG